MGLLGREVGLEKHTKPKKRKKKLIVELTSQVVMPRGQNKKKQKKYFQSKTFFESFEGQLNKTPHYNHAFSSVYRKPVWCGLCCKFLLRLVNILDG